MPELQRVSPFKPRIHSFQTAVALVLLLLAGAASAQTPASPAPAQTAVFKPGARSSGWIDFNLSINVPIFLPVRIKGQEVAAMLYGGPSMIDKDFAASAGIGAPATGSARTTVPDVQIGDLTLRNATMRVDAIAAPQLDRLAGRPVVLYLGREVFEQLTVDLDFAHHRVAFLDPAGFADPAGATRIPLQVKGDDQHNQWSVSLPVNGAEPVWFEIELGNVIGPLMVTRPYAEAQKLFNGHPTSQRLSGPYHETVVCIDHLKFAGLDFPHTPIAIIPDPEPPPPGVTGGLGLPLLSRFHLIFDYSGHRLLAIPNADVAAPLPKDRIGLVLRGAPANASQINFTVAFVAPGSPAEAAGFKAGDQMTQVDGKAYREWALADIVGFQMAPPGVAHTFNLLDGSMRTVISKDFF